MRTLIVCGLGALALSACQRPAEPNVAAAATDDALDAVALTDDAATGPVSMSTTSSTSATGSSGVTAGSGSAATRGPSTASGRAASERLSPTGSAGSPGDLSRAPRTMGDAGDGVGQDVRDGAKARAEETNLRPRTP